MEWPRAFTAAPPAPFDWPRLMGILNVTSDSFSDGGDHFDAAAAVEHGLRLAAEGADIVDVGGESTRPGARPVPVAEELRRVLPVVERLAAGVTVSIDTRKAEVMRAAVAAGAQFINDVSGLTHDPGSLEAAAASGAFVVLMHMAGEPATMNEAPPRYEQCALEVFDWLEARVAACEAPRPRARPARGRPGPVLRQARAREPRPPAPPRPVPRPGLPGDARRLAQGLDGSWIETGRTEERLPATLAATQWGAGPRRAAVPRARRGGPPPALDRMAGPRRSLHRRNERRGGGMTAASGPTAVGVIGLGSMGMGMARRLVEAGFAVRGYDVRPEAGQALAEAGGSAAACRRRSRATPGCCW